MLQTCKAARVSADYVSNCQRCRQLWLIFPMMKSGKLTDKHTIRNVGLQLDDIHTCLFWISAPFPLMLDLLIWTQSTALLGCWTDWIQYFILDLTGEKERFGLVANCYGNHHYKWKWGWITIAVYEALLARISWHICLSVYLINKQKTNYQKIKAVAALRTLECGSRMPRLTKISTNNTMN